MKKILLIFLSLLILFNTSGYILIVTQYKSEFRKEIKKADYYRHHKNELVCFRVRKDQLNVDNAEFFWEDENEFEFKGRMYDVVMMDETVNDFILYCINDVKEEKLTALAKQSASPSDSKDAFPLSKILVKKPLLLSITDNLEKDKLYSVSAGFCTIISEIYIPVTQTPDTPPPRLS